MNNKQKEELKILAVSCFGALVIFVVGLFLGASMNHRMHMLYDNCGNVTIETSIEEEV